MRSKPIFLNADVEVFLFDVTKLKFIMKNSINVGCVFFGEHKNNFRLYF